jgi:hypothetical protein
VKENQTDFSDLARDAGEAVVNQLFDIVKREVVNFVMEQVGKLIAQVAISLPVTTAACAGPQAIFTCIPAKAAMALAFSAITRVIMREVNRQMNRIGSFKGEAMNVLVGKIVGMIPIFKENEILKMLRFQNMLGGIIEAAWEKRDVSATVIEPWLKSLTQTFAQKLTEAATTGLDRHGGVLKGYVMRHRFRNLVEFDGNVGASKSAFRSAAKAADAPDGLNNWRSAFDRVYKENRWRAKATWIVKSPDEFEGLRSRYFDGAFLGAPKDKSGDGTAAWRPDSYKVNTGDYGFNGVIFYEGNQDLTLDWPSFYGKCIIYAPNANLIIAHCKMRDRTKDVLTVISGKNIKLPGEDVEISAHAVGNDSKIEMETSTKVFGSLVFKRYTVTDQSQPKASLKGELTYNEALDGKGGSAVDGTEETHLFVTISPYIIEKEVSLVPK